MFLKAYVSHAAQITPEPIELVTRRSSVSGFFLRLVIVDGHSCILNSTKSHLDSKFNLEMVQARCITHLRVRASHLCSFTL